jgi:hypothetical protein
LNESFILANYENVCRQWLCKKEMHDGEGEGNVFDPHYRPRRDQQLHHCSGKSVPSRDRIAREEQGAMAVMRVECACNGSNGDQREWGKEL